MQVEAGDEELSIIRMGTVLLRRWRLFLTVCMACTLFTILLVMSRPPVFVASATFMPQSSADIQGFGLSSLAGQLGMSIANNGAQSSDFFVELATADVVLREVVKSVRTSEKYSTAPASIMEMLLGAEAGTEQDREERLIDALRDAVSLDVSRRTGLVRIAVRTADRNLSLLLVSEMLSRLNEVNMRTRRGQAAAERQFAERRLEVARDSLRSVESQLLRFLQRNRQMNQSAELQFHQAQLQREVDMQQQLSLSIVKGLEEARLREVRDTPTIAVVQAPIAPSRADSRDRLLVLVMGILFTGIASLTAVFLVELVSKGTARNPQDIESFRVARRDFIRAIRSPFRSA